MLKKSFFGLFFVFFLGCSPLVWAQIQGVDSARVRPITSLDIGLSRGMEMAQNYPIIRAGSRLSLSMTYPVGHWLYLGGGVGYRKVEDDTFIPLFWESIGFFNPHKKSSLVYTQLGYSLASNAKINALEGYDYSGGAYFSMGAGYRFPLYKKSHFVFKLGYAYQRAKLSYDMPNLSYHETIGFDLIDFTVGIHF